MKRYVAGFMLACVASAAGAQSMNAENFFKRATALQKKGALAVFSMGEIKSLMAEGQAAANKAKDQRVAATRSGSRPRYCPPEGPQSMNSDEFMRRLGAIPAAERARIDMTEATNRILASKYPCSG